jgi:hypothetical protein
VTGASSSSRTTCSAWSPTSSASTRRCASATQRPASYFVVYQLCDQDGDERLVTTSQTFDQRLVERIRQITHESYDLAGELAREDDRRDRERDHEFSEQVGEIGERLFHAMRKDKGRTDTAFVKEGL